MAASLLLLMVSGASRWDPWEAIAHFRWDGAHLSILMEEERPPCGTEAGFAPNAYDIVNKVVEPAGAENSSVIFFLGDVMNYDKRTWSVMAEPCAVRTVVFTIVEDWHCAVLAPTPMEVHFENGEGYIKEIVDEVMVTANRSWNELNNQVFWRGARHFPHACTHLIRGNNPEVEVDPRADLAELSKHKGWLNASHAPTPRSEFLDHRYLLDVGGSACVTCALLSPCPLARAPGSTPKEPHSAPERCRPRPRLPPRWDALRWKLASGRLVFRVYLPARDWFHQFLEPWVHYIPVATDLSDLEARWLWAESHPEEAQRIAAAGAYLGQNKPPRSANADFASALEAARVPILHPQEPVARKFQHCHYGACSQRAACNDDSERLK
jgi:hypothetical protein